MKKDYDIDLGLLFLFSILPIPVYILSIIGVLRVLDGSFKEAIFVIPILLVFLSAILTDRGLKQDKKKIIKTTRIPYKFFSALLLSSIAALEVFIIFNKFLKDQFWYIAFFSMLFSYFIFLLYRFFYGNDFY